MQSRLICYLEKLLNLSMISKIHFTDCQSSTVSSVWRTMRKIAKTISSRQIYLDIKGQGIFYDVKEVEVY